MNKNLSMNNQMNFMSTMLASMVGFLLLRGRSSEAEGGFLSSFMGTKGLITAFIVAFVTINVYKVCFEHNVTIKMPGEVPPNISKVFKI